MLHGEQRDAFDLSFSVPSECAERLAQARADIGIVPCIELTRQKLEVIRGTGIACHGPVRSILLISKVPFAKIRTLAVDASSRTSVVLSRIILAKKYGAHPDIHAERPEVAPMLEHADACLVIGDPALLLDPQSLPFHVLDLGQEWTALTGLPMVFAVWAARPEFAGQDSSPFLKSLRFGLAHLDEIVEREYQARGVSRELARDYLTRNIAFELGEREYEGMALFLRYAAELPTFIDAREVSA